MQIFVKEICNKWFLSDWAQSLLPVTPVCWIFWKFDCIVHSTTATWDSFNGFYIQLRSLWSWLSKKWNKLRFRWAWNKNKQKRKILHNCPTNKLLALKYHHIFLWARTLHTIKTLSTGQLYLFGNQKTSLGKWF